MSANYFLTKVPVHALLARSDVRASPRSWNIDSPTFRHRAVMGLFGTLPEGGRKEAGILFRLERVPGQPPFFLVQSRISPEGLSRFEGAECREMDELSLQSGQPIAFRLAANAVRRKTIDVKGKRKTQVVSVPFDFDKGAEASGEDTVSPWLKRKLNGAISSVEVTNHLRDVLEDPKDERGKKVLQVDTYDGVGIVNDVERLKVLLADGVGRERSYGCGLLSVKAL